MFYFTSKLCLITIVVCLWNTVNANVTIDYEDLEKSYPQYFAGMGNLLKDEPLLREYTGQKKLTEVIPQFEEKYKELYHILEEVENPLLNPHREAVKIAIDNKNEHNVLSYVIHLLKISLELSDKEEEEELQFFKIAGFSYLYDLIDKKSELLKAPVFSFIFTDYRFDNPGDFDRFVHKNFFDRERVLDRELKKSSVASIPYWYPDRKDGILGLYYLSWSYLKGIHTVPIPIDPSDDILHGVVKSSWAKFCHDSAHSELDPSDHNVEQFAAHLLNHYTFLIGEKGGDLSKEIKKDFAVPQMIPAFTEFSLSVHELWRKSRLELLEAALTESLKKDELTPEFKAYIAACFMQDHEAAPLMDRLYGTNNFVELLNKSINNNQGNPKDPDEKVAVESVTDSLTTSFITGNTILTDEEIWNIVRDKPLSAYISHRNDFYYNNTKIEEKKVSTYEVNRNKYYIEVLVKMLNGDEHIFREATNYAKTLNFEHDTSILKEAETILRRNFDYEVPQIPLIQNYENSEVEYEMEVKRVEKQIITGFKHLQTYFGQITSALAQTTLSSVSKDLTVAEHFSKAYFTALQTLTQKLPIFIRSESQSQEIMEKTVQDFIDLAVKENK